MKLKLFLVYLVFQINKFGVIAAADQGNSAYQSISSEINSRNGNWGNWGNWGNAVFCPRGQYVIGFQTKLESRQGGGDDTALNGIRVRCSGQSMISSSEGPWGNWGEWSYCPNEKKVLGFQIKVESRQGGGDDTATNGVNFLCDDNTSIHSSEGPWGSWSPYFLCNDGYFMCGIQTQVESPIGKGDDTAMNNLRMYCCKY